MLFLSCFELCVDFITLLLPCTSVYHGVLCCYFRSCEYKGVILVACCEIAASYLASYIL